MPFLKSYVSHMFFTLHKFLAKKPAKTLSALKTRFLTKVWPDKSIVFYTGATPNEWNPDSLKTGIGGAEGRIIHLSREWVKQGYSVTVFNNCGNQEGTYDGVQYLNHQNFNQHDTFDTLIVWQFAWRIKFPIKATRVWLDLGKGVLLPEEAAYQKLKGYNKVFCKNIFHRSTLPEIPESKIAIIPNGIDKEFASLYEEPKDINRIIYASNYIRGLERMLEFGWPLIKSELPNAELHIFYGWGKNLDPAWKRKMLNLMEQPGVIEHGKVGRQQMMKEKSTSAIHYYGCTFKETDCNTVRESALVGCVPVTTDYAALTDKSYCVKVSGNPYNEETQKALACKVVELLKNPSELSVIREQFVHQVRNETWENIAKLWLAQK